MKLKVKRKYRPSKFKKHFKKTYKKKNRTHRIKKHRKNKTKNNRRKSKKYFGGGESEAENLVTRHLMEKIKKISTKGWWTGLKKGNEQANCKKLNDLVDEMHKLESSSSIQDMENMKNKRVKVYNMPVKNSFKKEAKVGEIKYVMPDKKAHIKWVNGGVVEDIELRIRTLDSKGFTKGKVFMFVGNDDNYKPYKKK